MPGHGGVHVGAAQGFVGGNLAGGGLEQRRPGQEHLGLVAYRNDVVGQARLVGAAGGGVAMHHGDLGNPGRGQPGLIGEAPGPGDENVRGVVKIGTTAFRQGNHRQLVLKGNLLQAQSLVQPGRSDGAPLDGTVAGDHQTADARDHPDAADQAAAGLAAVRVVVHLVAGEGAEFEKLAAPVQQAVEAVPGEQFAPPGETGPGRLGQVQCLLLRLAEDLQVSPQGVVVGPVLVRARVNVGGQWLHGAIL